MAKLKDFYQLERNILKFKEKIDGIASSEEDGAEENIKDLRIYCLLLWT